METGRVYFLKYPSLELIRTCTHHTDTISNIKYSIKRNFIAIVDFKGELSVRRHCNYELVVEYENMDFFTWHPWIETDLIIGLYRIIIICDSIESKLMPPFIKST